jgi:CRP-like cAMP-binding protein
MISHMPEYVVGVEAVWDSVVLLWDARTFHGLVQRVPKLVENALSITSYYLAWYLAAHAALCSQTAEERLSHILLEYATKAGRKVPGGIEVDATDQELADAADVTHHTTSRLITAWERTGLLHKQPDKIIVWSPERLFHVKETDGGG